MRESLSRHAGVVSLASPIIPGDPDKVAAESKGVFECQAAVNPNASSVDDDTNNGEGMYGGLSDVAFVDAFEWAPVDHVKELVKPPGRVMKPDRFSGQRR